MFFKDVNFNDFQFSIENKETQVVIYDAALLTKMGIRHRMIKFKSNFRCFKEKPENYGNSVMTN